MPVKTSRRAIGQHTALPPAPPGSRFAAAIGVYNADYDAAFTALRAARDTAWAQFCQAMADANANFDRDVIAAGARYDSALIPGPQGAA